VDVVSVSLVVRPQSTEPEARGEDRCVFSFGDSFKKRKKGTSVHVHPGAGEICGIIFMRIPFSPSPYIRASFDGISLDLFQV